MNLLNIWWCASSHLSLPPSISLFLSLATLSTGQHRYGEFGFAYQNDEKLIITYRLMAEMINTGLEIDQWGNMKNGSAHSSARLCVCVWVYGWGMYVCVGYMRICGDGRWESEERWAGSAVRRTRGTVVPSLIPGSLLLPLPCSSAQGGGCDSPDCWGARPKKNHERDEGLMLIHFLSVWVWMVSRIVVIWRLQVCRCVPMEETLNSWMQNHPDKHNRGPECYYCSNRQSVSVEDSSISFVIHIL